MAKQTGLGDNLYVGGYNISGDTGSVDTISGGPATLDVTDITQSAHSRLGGLRSGEIDFTAFFDSASVAVGGYVGAHGVLSLLPTSDVLVSYFRGVGVGSPAACCLAKQINYDPTRATDGALTIKVQAQSNAFGLEWGEQLTAGIRTDTAATTGTTQDDLAATNFGAQAYLQMFSFVGTDVTIKIQDSANGSTWADVSGFAFTQITATTPQSQRIAIANNATLREFVRVTTVTTGGFTSCAFAVVLVRNQIAGQVF